MARLWTGGAEWNTGIAEGSAGNPADIQTGTVRSGARAWRFNTTGHNIDHTFTGVLGTGYYGRAYINLAAAGSVAFELVSLYSGTTGYWIRLNTDNTLQLVFEATPGGTPTNIGTPSAALSTGTWYRVELFAQIGSGSSDDSAEFRLDGATIASETNQTRSTAPLTDFSVGDPVAVSSGADVYCDDCALNDSTGAAQNSWPGSGKVVLLVPATDSAVGAGWTLGSGTAISANSGSTAVKNEPPLGVADLAVGSDVKQIRNASSNANSNYDANLTTYAAAGIGASDTINVLVPMVTTGAPVVTSAKAGTYGIVSNPAIANVSLGAGGTSGAFWSGFAAGTYNTGWKLSFGTTTYAPTVTVGTAPVARITQVTSSTRIAMVCAMGMYVDYTPAVTTLPPLPVYVDSAVARSTNY